MSVQKYHPVETNKFIHLDKLPCDIYIKLGVRKFVRIIKENTEYNKEIILKYNKTSPTVFHVTSNGLDGLMNFETNLLKKLNKVNKLNPKDNAAKNLWSVQLLQEQFRNQGVSDVIIETADIIIKDSIKNLKQDYKLRDLIENILRKNDYIVEHSLMITYIAMEICQILHWNNEATYQKIALASLIHDCLLKDPLHAQLDRKELIEDAPISEKEKKEILNHPQEISKLVQGAKRFIPDVDKIIIEHHERPDGSGFPFGITGTKIHSLACLFIMCEDFVDIIYNSPLNKELIQKIKADFEITYNSGNFRKVLEAFNYYFDHYLKLE